MFGSDNQRPAHPAVIEAIARANAGGAGSYGDDEWTRRACALVRDVFETDDLDLHLVATGGAANGLALSSLCPPWAAVVCHAQAHIVADEGSGPEMFTGGARLLPAGGGAEAPKLTPAHLDEIAALHRVDFVHGPQPRAVSITNLSEEGLAYTPEETAALGKACQRHGWALHVDGARLANSLAAQGCQPADLTWRAGVSALSLGLTKTGALMAEAVVLFGAARDRDFGYRRKRAGQLVSKHRFLSAQVVAMMEDGLWLRLASQANAAAKALSARLSSMPGCRLLRPVDGNEVFAALTAGARATLEAEGITGYDWPAMGPGAMRFVAGWDVA